MDLFGIKRKGKKLHENIKNGIASIAAPKEIYIELPDKEKKYQEIENQLMTMILEYNKLALQGKYVACLKNLENQIKLNLSVLKELNKSKCYDDIKIHGEPVIKISDIVGMKISDIANATIKKKAKS